MNNIEQLTKNLKTLKIIRLICIITVIICLPLIGITAPKSTILATIFTFTGIIAIIIGLILDKKIKTIKYDLREIKNIKRGIEDSKN